MKSTILYKHLNKCIMERETIIAKRIEAIIGIVMLLPAIIGIISFIVSFFSGGFDLKYLRVYGCWDWQSTDGGASASPAPVFLGLLAIASVLILKDSLKYLFVQLPPKK